MADAAPLAKFLRLVLLKKRLKSISALCHLAKPTNFDELVFCARQIKICSSYLQSSIISSIVMQQINNEEEIIRALSNFMVSLREVKLPGKSTAQFLEEILDLMGEEEIGCFRAPLMKLESYLSLVYSPDYSRISSKIRNMTRSSNAVQISKLFEVLQCVDVASCEMLMTDFYSARFKLSNSSPDLEEKRQSFINKFSSKSLTDNSSKSKKSEPRIEERALTHMMLLKQERDMLQRLKPNLIDFSAAARCNLRKIFRTLYTNDANATLLVVNESFFAKETTISKLLETASQTQNSKSRIQNFSNSSSYFQFCSLLCLKYDTSRIGYWHSFLHQLQEHYHRWSGALQAGNLEAASAVCEQYMNWPDSITVKSLIQGGIGSVSTNSHVLACMQLVELEARNVMNSAKFMKNLRKQVSFVCSDLCIQPIDQRGNFGLEISCNDSMTVLLNLPVSTSHSLNINCSISDQVHDITLELAETKELFDDLVSSDNEWCRLLETSSSVDYEVEVSDFMNKLAQYLQIVTACLNGNRCEISVPILEFPVFLQTKLSFVVQNEVSQIGLRRCLLMIEQECCNQLNSPTLIMPMPQQSNSALSEFLAEIATICRKIRQFNESMDMLKMIKLCDGNVNLLNVMEGDQTVNALFWLQSWNLLPTIQSWIKSSVISFVVISSTKFLSDSLKELKPVATFKDIHRSYSSILTSFIDSSSSFKLLFNSVMYIIDKDTLDICERSSQLAQYCVNGIKSITSRSWTMLSDSARQIAELVDLHTEFSKFRQISQAMETESSIGMHEDSLIELEEQSNHWIDAISTSSGISAMDSVEFIKCSTKSEDMLCRLSESQFDQISSLSGGSRQLLLKTVDDREKYVCQRTDEELLFLSNCYTSMLINLQRHLVVSGDWEDLCNLWRSLRHKDLASRLYLPHWVMQEISIASFLAFERASRLWLLEAIRSPDGKLTLNVTGELVTKSHDSDPLSEAIKKITKIKTADKYVKPSVWPNEWEVLLNASQLLSDLRSMSNMDQWLQICVVLMAKLCSANSATKTAYDLWFINKPDMSLVAMGKLINDSHFGDPLSLINESVDKKHFNMLQVRFDDQWNHLDPSNVPNELLQEISIIVTAAAHIVVASLLCNMTKLLDFCVDDLGFASLSAHGFDDMTYIFEEMESLALKYDTRRLSSVRDLVKDIKSMVSLFGVSHKSEERMSVVSIGDSFNQIVSQVSSKSETNSQDVANAEEKVNESVDVDFDFDDMSSRSELDRLDDITFLFEVDYTNFESELVELKEEILEDFSRKSALNNLLSQFRICSAAPTSEDAAKLGELIDRFKLSLQDKFVSPLTSTIISIAETLLLLTTDLPKLLNSLRNPEGASDQENEILRKLKTYCGCVVPSVLDEVRIMFPQWQSMEVDHTSLFRIPFLCSQASISSILIYGANILKAEKRKIETFMEVTEHRIILKDCICLMKNLKSQNLFVYEEFPIKLWKNSKTIAACAILRSKFDASHFSVKEAVQEEKEIEYDPDDLSICTGYVCQLRNFAADGDVAHTCQCADKMESLLPSFPCYLRDIVVEEYESMRNYVTLDLAYSTLATQVSESCITSTITCFEYVTKCHASLNRRNLLTMSLCDPSSRLLLWHTIFRDMHCLRRAVACCDWNNAEKCLVAVQSGFNEMQNQATNEDVLYFEQKCGLSLDKHLKQEINVACESVRNLSIFENFLMEIHCCLSRGRNSFFLCSDSGFDEIIAKLAEAEDNLGVSATHFIGSIKVCVDYIISNSNHADARKSIAELKHFWSYLQGFPSLKKISDLVERIASFISLRMDQKRFSIVQSTRKFVVLFEISTFLKQTALLICDGVDVDFKLHKPLKDDYCEQVLTVRSVIANESEYFDIVKSTALNFLDFAESSRFSISSEILNDLLDGKSSIDLSGPIDVEYFLKLCYCMMGVVSTTLSSTQGLKICSIITQAIDNPNSSSFLQPDKKSLLLSLVSYLYSKQCQMEFLEKCNRIDYVPFDSSQWNEQETDVLDIPWTQLVETESFHRILFSPKTSKTLECCKLLVHIWRETLFEGMADKKKQRSTGYIDLRSKPSMGGIEGFLARYGNAHSIGRGIVNVVNFVKLFLLIKSELEATTHSLSVDSCDDDWIDFSASLTKIFEKSSQESPMTALRSTFAKQHCGNAEFIESIAADTHSIAKLHCREQFHSMKDLEVLCLDVGRIWIERVTNSWGFFLRLAESEQFRDPSLHEQLRAMALKILSRVAQVTLLAYPTLSSDSRSKLMSAANAILEKLKLADLGEPEILLLATGIDRCCKFADVNHSSQACLDSFWIAFNSINSALHFYHKQYSASQAFPAIRFNGVASLQASAEPSQLLSKLCEFCELDTELIQFAIKSSNQLSNFPIKTSMISEYKQLISFQGIISSVTPLLLKIEGCIRTIMANSCEMNAIEFAVEALTVCHIVKHLASELKTYELSATSVENPEYSYLDRVLGASNSKSESFISPMLMILIGTTEKWLIQFLSCKISALLKFYRLSHDWKAMNQLWFKTVNLMVSKDREQAESKDVSHQSSQFIDESIVLSELSECFEVVQKMNSMTSSIIDQCSNGQLDNLLTDLAHSSEFLIVEASETDHEDTTAYDFLMTNYLRLKDKVACNLCMTNFISDTLIDDNFRSTDFALLSWPLFDSLGMTQWQSEELSHCMSCLTIRCQVGNLKNQLRLASKSGEFSVIPNLIEMIKNSNFQLYSNNVDIAIVHVRQQIIEARRSIYGMGSASMKTLISFTVCMKAIISKHKSVDQGVDEINIQYFVLKAFTLAESSGTSLIYWAEIISHMIDCVSCESESECHRMLVLVLLIESMMTYEAMASSWVSKVESILEWILYHLSAPQNIAAGNGELLSLLCRNLRQKMNRYWGSMLIDALHPSIRQKTATPSAKQRMVQLSKNLQKYLK